MNLQFNRVDIADLIVIVGLVLTLFASVINGMNELAMSIASGLLGYIGGSAGSTFKRNNPGNQVSTPIEEEQRFPVEKK